MKHGDIKRLINGIKRQVSIVDVAGKYMQLRGRGNRYRGLCPFHSEKTASFTVYADSGHFKCFGCGKYGDVIDLWAHFNRVGKRIAIRKLMAMYSIDDPIEYEPTQQEVDRFLDKKRRQMKLLIGSYIFEMEELYISKALPGKERKIYIELMKLEYWYAGIDEMNDVSLKALYDRVPRHLIGLYHRFWAGGMRIECWSGMAEGG